MLILPLLIWSWLVLYLLVRSLLIRLLLVWSLLIWSLRLGRSAVEAIWWTLILGSILSLSLIWLASLIGKPLLWYLLAVRKESLRLIRLIDLLRNTGPRNTIREVWPDTLGWKIKISLIWLACVNGSELRVHWSESGSLVSFVFIHRFARVPSRSVDLSSRRESRWRKRSPVVWISHKLTVGHSQERWNHVSQGAIGIANKLRHETWGPVQVLQSETRRQLALRKCGIRNHALWVERSPEGDSL